MRKLDETTLLKKEWLILCGIILLAFVLRLYRINYPLADWHSFRQVDTASVTREYVKNGIDVLHPRYHDLSNIQSGSGSNDGFYKTLLLGIDKYPQLHTAYHGFNNARREIVRPIYRLFGIEIPLEQIPPPAPAKLPDNVEGWRMVEMPFMNGIIAGVLRAFPFLPLIQTSRMFSIIFSLGTLMCLYFLSKNLWNERVAQLTALTFAVLPYSVFYSRTILPEPFMLLFSTCSILFFHLWLQHNKVTYFSVSAMTLALALLLKPFVIFLAPVYAMLFFTYFFKNKTGKQKLLISAFSVIFVAISLMPLLLWRKWILQFPLGIPASDWLFNSNAILFRPVWFRWLGYERLTKLFLGYSGIVFILFALLPMHLSKYKETVILQIRNLQLTSNYLLLISWWVGILSYFIIIATGNVQHDYYQNLMLPIVCLSVGVGIVQLDNFLKKLKIGTLKFTSKLSTSLIALIYVAMLALSGKQVQGYFNVNHWDYIEAGKAVDQLTPPDAKVIAPAQGDTVFLFQTNRTGWPIGFDIDDKISNGAQYYVTTNYDDEARELERKYEIVEKGQRYIILDLKKPIRE